jgi:hypothetical protein
MARMRDMICRGAALALAVALAGEAAEAQMAATDSGPDSVAAVQPPKKKGGLFGKMRSVAGNKAVQSVAKTAACTMVPGGQVIAGAIDAAGSNSANGAAAGAAAAATGTSCMGGYGAGMGASGGNLTRAAVGAGTGAAVDAAMSGMGPGTGMPTGALGYGSAGAMPGTDGIAECMGLTPEEFTALADPTEGRARAPTKDVMKKVDMRKYQSCLMQAMPSGE